MLVISRSKICERKTRCFKEISGKLFYLLRISCYNISLIKVLTKRYYCIDVPLEDKLSTPAVASLATRIATGTRHEAVRLPLGLPGLKCSFAVH